MMSKEDQAVAVSRFTEAVRNIAVELLGAGVQPGPLAAALRMRTAEVEAKASTSTTTPNERELIDLAAKAHEFINTLQIAGIEEHVAVTALSVASVERVVRSRGGAAAATWLRSLASLVEDEGQSFAMSAQRR